MKIPADCADFKYGVTRDYVIALEVVMPNGDIIRTGGKLAKDVAGYDLNPFVCRLRRNTWDDYRGYFKINSNAGIEKNNAGSLSGPKAAAKSVSAIIAHKIIPTTLEFLDQPTLKVVEDFAQIGLPTDVKAVLFIEQDGPPEVVERDLKRMAEICKQENAVSIQIAASQEEADALLTARRTALSRLPA